MPNVAINGDDYNGTTSVTTMPANAQLNATGGNPKSIVVNLFYRGLGGGSTGYICSDCDSAQANGFRFFISSTGQLSFGLDSTGTAVRPLRQSNTLFAIGHQYTFAATWDGGLLASGIILYSGIDGASVAAESTYSLSGDGSTAIKGSTASMLIGNRAGLARTFDGLEYQLAFYNTVLSLSDIQQIQSQGAASVAGLQFNFNNHFDYGRQRIPVTSTANVTTGAAAGFPWPQSPLLAPMPFRIG